MTTTRDSHPIVLSPATPTELLHYIVSSQQYPTTLIVGCSKQDFIATLALTVTEELRQHEDVTTTVGQTFLRPPPLFQIAVSRHIRLVFTPTVTHFRAWTATFLATESKIPAPPKLRHENRPPLLMVYGLLELHRDAGDWSAQEIGTSAAILVDSAARNSFRPVIVEPRGAGGHETSEELLAEQLPLLQGASRKDDGTWRGRTVSTRRTLGRWFTFESHDWNLRQDLVTELFEQG